jgi:hypothetical protein
VKAPRGGRIELNLSLLRMVLDLPENCSIVEIRQSDNDRAMNVAQLIVSSPYAPEWNDGDELAVLRPIYRAVNCQRTELVRIEGLDT